MASGAEFTDQSSITALCLRDATFGRNMACNTCKSTRHSLPKFMPDMSGCDGCAG